MTKITEQDYWDLIAHCWRGNSEEARKLTSAHPELVNHKLYMGESPLHYSAVEGQLSAMALLLELDADPNATDKSGDSILQSCVMLGRHDAVRLLLMSGAHPNHESPSNDCPLKLAKWNNDPVMVELLEQYGATDGDA